LLTNNQSFNECNVLGLDKSWNVEAGTGAGRRGEAGSWRREEEEGVEKKIFFLFVTKKKPLEIFPLMHLSLDRERGSVKLF